MDDSEKVATLEKIPEWACNEKMAVLQSFRDYFGKRREELTEALSNGMGLNTWDPYLSGFSQGMRSGLEVAEDLVYSYMEWVMREVYWPDERDIARMDP